MSAQLNAMQDSKIRQTLSVQFGIAKNDSLSLPADTLIKSLSFSHLVELMKFDDSLKRCFYEFECTKGNWSIRELKRQIASLYYERSTL